MADSVSLGSSLGDFHMRLMRAFEAQRAYLRPRVEELGLGPGQPKLLVYLAVHGPSSQRELAEFFECDPVPSRGCSTRWSAGFVVSAPGRDRRTKAVTLTERGLSAARAWDEVCAGSRRSCSRASRPTRRAVFADLLSARGPICAARSTKGRPSMDGVRLIAHYLGPYRRDFLVAVLCVAVETSLELVIPMLMANVVDDGILAGDLDAVVMNGGLMLVFSFFSLALGFLYARFSARAAMGLGARLREAEYAHLQEFRSPTLTTLRAPRW